MGKYVYILVVVSYFENCSFFFFSSRRRHTRLVSDWSSDVCSSDLTTVDADPSPAGEPVGCVIEEPFRAIGVGQDHAQVDRKSVV